MSVGCTKGRGVGEVVGDRLLLALAVAASPIPVIATILMLLPHRATSTGVGFLIGWVAGLGGVTTLSTVVAIHSGLSEDSGRSSAVSSWTSLLLGGVALLVAVRQWRRRPRSRTETTLPKWMATIDTFSFSKAAGLGVVLSALNPKNLAICAAAGVAIGEATSAARDRFVAIVAFTVIGASTVAAPVIAYLVARDRLIAPLAVLRAWLVHNSAPVVSTLLGAIGILLIASGLAGL